MSVNCVSISGHLTRDCELRQTGGGTSVARFGVAVNERRRNQQTGEWEDYPNFVDCVLFGNRAEKVAQWLAKGTKVAVCGRLHYSSWEKDGQRRSRLEVVVDELEFMSRSDGQAERQAAQAAAPAPMPQAPQPASAELRQAAGAIGAAFPGATVVPDMYDEDIPF